ncbi:hypothetical protein K3495_g14371 [Podosphaera aphanis]|nr:hypothetical protein K3495_g14371 [Podosphaera aphanis]
MVAISNAELEQIIKEVVSDKNEIKVEAHKTTVNLVNIKVGHRGVCGSIVNEEIRWQLNVL